MTDAPRESYSSELPSEVVQRIVGELAGRGEKVIACIRTAAAFIAQAVADDRGLRLAESAGYNLREALDAVVAGRSPVDGGLPAVLEAWDRYQSELSQVDSDSAESLRALEDALRRVAEKRDRSSYHAARLLGYLRAKTGVDPLPGELDPIRNYTNLRSAANTALHAESVLDAVTALYSRVVAWFIRMFTPPDAVVDALAMLAAQPWQSAEQMAQLRELATNPHHLRLFFGKLSDPAWLTPLYEGGLVQLPQADTPWPATGLLDGLGRTSPTEVAPLFERLLADCKKLPPEQRVGARFELLRAASRLDSAGYPVVASVAAYHPKVLAVRALAVGAVKSADPADKFVAKVAGALLGGEPLDREIYHTRVLCERLEAGLNPANAVERTRLMAAKVRLMASHVNMKFVPLDIARLTAEPGRDHDQVATITFRFARVLSRARELGVSTSELLSWTTTIPGELGERLVCRILADAEDIPIQEKIKHVSVRMKSTTATGDDRDLIENIMSTDPDPRMFDIWTETLGTPSETPSDPEAALPRDWAKAWRWSLVLPESVLLSWREPIAQVAARYGPPQPEALDQRSELPEMLSGRSPYSEEELSEMPVLEAASRIAAWRPGEDSERHLVGPRELARTLEAVVKAAVDEWTLDPTAIVTTLREPVYVLHYLYALTEQAPVIASRVSLVLDAATVARNSRWTPVTLGRDDFDFEPTWRRVNVAIIELAAALANQSADLAAYVGDIWKWALELVDLMPDGDSESSNQDALHRAINSSRGKAFQAVLALAGWEKRNVGVIRAEFVQLLDDAIQIQGDPGMEYRAILASHRPFLEAVVPTWLETNGTRLFSDGDMGRATLDLTIKYSRPTTWFYGHFAEELFGAARRLATNAVGWLLVAALREEEGYTVDEIIDGLRGNVPALAAAANEVAFLVQNTEPGTSQLDTAVEFWQALIRANRVIVPAEVLHGSGRWAFVSALPDETWAELTLQTLEVTAGIIDLPGEVADRCKSALAFENAARILILLLGNGEPWEQHHVARTAIEALGALALRPAGGAYQSLRTRLIELGHHEAAEIAPANNDDQG